MWLTCCLCVFQVRAEITSKEKEEEDMMEKVQKETKYETTSFCVPSVLHKVIMFRYNKSIRVLIQ